MGEGSHCEAPVGSGVLSAPRGTAVLPCAVNTSGHWVLLGEVQPEFAGKAGSGRAALSSRHRPEPSGSCLQLRVCASGWRLGEGGAGGGPAVCPRGCAAACSLLHALFLSQLTSQEFAPEPERQARESPSAPPATAPSPSSVPRLKGAAPRQPGQARGPGARLVSSHGPQEPQVESAPAG